MKFAPRINNSDNLPQRVEAFRRFTEERGYFSKMRPMVQRAFVAGEMPEHYLSFAFDDCIRLTNDAVLPELLPLLSAEAVRYYGSMLIGRSLLVQHPELFPHVLPYLGGSDINALFKQCVSEGKDDVFDQMRPYLVDSDATAEILEWAGRANTPTFGAFLIERLDMMAFFKEHSRSSGRATVANWWALAIQEGRVPIPSLGSRPGYWRKTFPLLDVVLRAHELDTQIPDVKKSPSNGSRF